LLLIYIPLANASDAIIFSNTNKNVVHNLKTTTFQLTSPMFITRIDTYHWNDQKGSPPGKIGIRGVGVWQAKGWPGMHNTPNANWTVYPNIRLEPGIYSITDSDPATWSQNSGSGGFGFVEVFGKPINGTSSTSSTSESLSSSAISGTWNSNWGEMVFKQSGNSITGTYATSNGKVYGTINGNILEGYWTQSSAGKKCSTQKYGSYYWGRIKFVFDKNEHFSGNWGYCNNTPSSGGWSGKKR